MWVDTAEPVSGLNSLCRMSLVFEGESVGIEGIEDVVGDVTLQEGYPALISFFSAAEPLPQLLCSDLETPTSTTTAASKMPSTHDKEKPWDTEDIDKWKVSKTDTFFTSL